MNKVDCAICCENVRRTQITECPVCDFECCKKCVRRYLSSLEINQPDACLSCNASWNWSFLVKALGKAWMNGPEYRKRQKDIWLGVEKAKLEDTMPAVELYKNNKKIEQQREKIEQKRKGLKEKDEKYRQKLQGLTIRHRGNGRIKRTNFQYACRCPADNCNGLIRKSDFKCVVCPVKVCKSCHEIKTEGETHACDEDTLKSKEFIREDTKPCPRCAVPIHKMYGCDQMWCTVCKVAFLWKTGYEITDRPFHNPHALEYQARTGYQPRAAGDEICGGLVNPLTHVSFESLREDPGETLHAIYRYARETEDMFIRRFRTSDLDSGLEKLRVKYIIGEINEKAWRTGVLRTHRKREIQVHRLQLYELGYTVVVERFNEFRNAGPDQSDEDYQEVIDAVKEVTEFINEQLTEILGGYGVAHKTYFLTPTFRVVANAKKYANPRRR